MWKLTKSTQDRDSKALNIQLIELNMQIIPLYHTTIIKSHFANVFLTVPYFYAKHFVPYSLAPAPAP